MILIFGGTTEGRAAVNVIEEAGKPYYYSTKGDEQDIYLHHGIRPVSYTHLTLPTTERV